MHALLRTTVLSATMSAVKKVERLTFPFQTPDPFLFAVYHDDKYPPGDGQMRAPRTGNGADFDPSREYRMYHGERVPGFPQHPHRGFETITATMEGLVDHTDSVGNAGRYGQGDVQWMTAGKGIVHGEMFPLVNDDAPNPLRLFQIWLNLPARSKMVDTAFVMHWAEDVQSVTDTDAGYELVVWAGELMVSLFFIFVWAISMKSCFVHRDARVRNPRQRRGPPTRTTTSPSTSSRSTRAVPSRSRRPRWAPSATGTRTSSKATP